MFLFMYLFIGLFCDSCVILQWWDDSGLCVDLNSRVYQSKMAEEIFTFQVTLCVQ